MNNFYLNHNYLTMTSTYNIECHLGEIARFIPILRINNFGFKIREDIWSTELIEGGTLQHYLHKHSGVNEVATFIIGIMNSGPYFSSTPTLQPTIKPTFQSKLCEELLAICFEDGQSYILSLENENCLIESNYKVSTNSKSLEIINCIGIPSLESFFEKNLILKNIFDVFNEITKRISKIIILPSAIKSARQHNFHGRYSEVLYTILALEIDLKLLEDNVNDKERMKFYKMETGFDISGESNETLNRKRYEAQRLFVVPGLGKKLFEWHIKIGPFIRIHYYIDVVSHIIYIGHCGKHLDI
ncbi:hypothetical protein [Paenibacillus qinlingensis]|uniref:hypothetical protein n=1 Tax=Paenibacillus qinlingensis TaxID=1837343 RepID=UPI001564C7DA|nr:hypothetical protein [Paenibacillus qinlingensis]NQX62891.1 hypothetical protein [Paenibacillus qinlingensis]